MTEDYTDTEPFWKRGKNLKSIVRHVSPGPTICDARSVFDEAMDAVDAGYLKGPDDRCRFEVTDKGRTLLSASVNNKLKLWKEHMEANKQKRDEPK